MRDRRIVIVGAGIAGLSTALGLERHGIAPIVLERAPGRRGAGYMLDFFGPGYDAAARLGVLEGLSGIHDEIGRVVFVDGDGTARVDVPYRDMRRRLFADRHFNFARGDLEALLLDRLTDSDVRYASAPMAIEASGSSLGLTLADGSLLEADVLVGADGIHSWVRGQLFGPESTFLRPLDHAVIAYLVDGLIDTGYRDALVTLTVPGRMVAAYPVRGGRLAAFFCRRGGRLDDDPIASLERDFGDLGWIVPELIAAAPPHGEIYRGTVDQVVMGRWHAGRTALVGDAAWCVSLLAGQGASLAVAGGEALADALSGAADVASALAGWERRLRPLVEARQRAGRQTVDWFVPTSGWRLAVRALVLRASVWPVVSGLVARAIGVRPAA